MDRDRISDRDWAVISPFLPSEQGRNCRPAHDNRLVFAGMLWILRSGAPWRDLPSTFGKWNSVYRRFRRWCEAGVFDDLLETLVELGMTEDWRVQMVDSTVAQPRRLYEQDPPAHRRCWTPPRLSDHRRTGFRQPPSAAVDGLDGRDPTTSLPARR